MAILSNINDLFRVDSAGAVYFATSAGANLQVLQSVGTGGSPIWVDVDDIIGGPYLPLAGGTLTGNLALTDATNNPSLVISTGTLTVGGATTLNAALSGTSATFTSNVTSTNLLTVSGDGHLFLGATGETPKIDMMYVDSASGLGWDTRIFTGKTDDLPNGQGFPTSTSAGGYGTQYQANSDGAFFGIIPYPSAASTNYRPVINWGDDIADSPFSFQFNGVDKATVSSAGVITAPTFVGALTGNATTATTLQTARTIAGVSFNGSANISLNNNAITNGAGYTTNTGNGTVTSVAAGNGLAGGTITTTGTLSTVHLPSFDTRSVNPDPEDYANLIRFDFKSNGTNGLSDGGGYNGQMTWRSYGSGADLSGGQPIRLAYTANGNLWRQMGTSATSWGSWAKFALETSGGFLPLSGGTLTGALQIGNYTDATETITIATSSNGTGRINFYDQNDTEGGSIRVVGQNLGSKMYFSNRWNTDSDKIVFDLINGRVGIGITNPTNQLHVHTDDDNAYAIRIEGSTNNGAGIWTGLGIGGESTNSKAALLFQDIGVSYARGKIHLCVNNELNQNIATPTDARLTVTNSGYTKIKNANNTYWDGYDFHAITSTTANQPTLMVYNSYPSGGNQYGLNVIHASTAANTTGRFFLGATNNGATEKIKIYTNGNIQNTNNSYTQLSDLSLKENVVDATDKLEEVKKLRVINWNFIGDDLKQIGVAAQEVEKIFPGLVDEVEHNQDGETSIVKSVKYSVFVPILIKAIQELEARVKELENK